MGFVEEYKEAETSDYFCPPSPQQIADTKTYRGVRDRLCLVEMGINDGEPRQVWGSGSYEWLRNLGCTPFDTGLRITHFRMIKNHNGYLDGREEPEKPKGKKVSQKRMDKTLAKLEKYLA